MVYLYKDQYVAIVRVSEGGSRVGDVSRSSARETTSAPEEGKLKKFLLPLFFVSTY